jgi:hypothetical protein
MSLLQVVAPLASLCFFSALSIAQVSAPNCTSAAWQWVRTPWFRQLIVWPLSDPMNCVQTFNSLGQNPCTVTAYMMATCDGGSESSGLFPIVCASGPCGHWSYLFQITHFLRCPQETCTTMARTVVPTPTCAIAIPSHIRSLVHVVHAKDRNGIRAVVMFS